MRENKKDGLIRGFYYYIKNVLDSLSRLQALTRLSNNMITYLVNLSK